MVSQRRCVSDRLPAALYRGVVSTVAWARVGPGALNGNGSALQCTGRPEALAQLSIQVSCAATSLRGARAAPFGVLASGLVQAFKLWVLGSGSRDVPAPPKFAQQRFNKALDNVALPAFGIASNFHSRIWLAGCSPNFGWPNLWFPSDADPFCPMGGPPVARALADSGIVPRPADA